MKQHPIPQDITNYKFHLIGSMTLKQFAELVAGAIIAFIIYSSNLIVIVKWPLLIFVVVLAVAIAFVPIEERPLDHWIVTFIKNLWKPTKFFWRKKPQVPDFFNYRVGKITQEGVNPEINYSPARRGRVKEYLQSVPQAKDELDDWDKQRLAWTDNLLKDFDQIKVRPENIRVEKSESKPALKTKTRAIGTPDKDLVVPPSKTNTIIDGETALVGEVNQISGQVVDQQGQAIANALVEIRNQDLKQTLRLIKTDTEGKFQANSTLPNGNYLITVEAQDLLFPETTVELTGQVFQALQIQAS